MDSINTFSQTKCVLVDNTVYYSPLLYAENEVFIRGINLADPGAETKLSSSDNMLYSQKSDFSILIDSSDIKNDEILAVKIYNNGQFEIDHNIKFSHFIKVLPFFSQDIKQFPRRAAFLKNYNNPSEYIIYGGEYFYPRNPEIRYDHDNLLNGLNGTLAYGPFYSPLDRASALAHGHVIRLNVNTGKFSLDKTSGPRIIDAASIILNNKLYLIGGYDLDRNLEIPANNITYYDLSSGIWDNFKALDQPETIIGASVVANGQNIYLTGGCGDYTTQLNDCNLRIKKETLNFTLNHSSVSNTTGFMFGCSVIFKNSLYHLAYSRKKPLAYELVAHSIDMESFKVTSLSKKKNHTDPSGFPSIPYQTDPSAGFYSIMGLFTVNFFLIIICLAVFLNRKFQLQRIRKLDDKEFKNPEPVWSEFNLNIQNYNLDLSLSSSVEFSSELDSPFISKHTVSPSFTSNRPSPFTHNLTLVASNYKEDPKKDSEF